jgi:NitT/TauT family transport system substrate-binding protein
LAILPLLLAAVLVTPIEVEARKYHFAYNSDAPTSNVPFWVAKERGLFKKHGLDLEMIFINGSTRTVQALLGGDLDFGGAVGTAAINGQLAGGKIAIINSLVNTLPYYVIGLPDIKSPQDLKGRAAATHIPGTSADFALRLALLKVGLSYKDIKAVTVGGSTARMAAVMTKQLDFAVVTEAAKLTGEKAGLKVVINMAELNIPFLFTCTVTKRETIEKDPKAVASVVRALAEAVHYYKTNKEGVIKIMQKYTRGQKRSILEGAYDAYTQLYPEDTYPSLEGLQGTLDAQAAWDPKAAGKKAADFVDLRFVDELKKSGFIRKLYGR